MSYSHLQTTTGQPAAAGSSRFERPQQRGNVIRASSAGGQQKLIVPRYHLNSFGRQCFAVAGPSTWNSLPDSLHDPALSLNIFRHQLKTLFCALEIF